MAEHKDEGTGKHPHKSTEEPYPHHEGGSQERGQSEHAHASSRKEEHESRDQGSESSNLKEREYRDAQGNVHHHTQTYEEQHGKK